MVFRVSSAVATFMLILSVVVGATSHATSTDAISLLQSWVANPYDEMQQAEMHQLFKDPDWQDPATEGYNRTEWKLSDPHFTSHEPVDSDAGKDNLCAFGHFIPEFLLIGVVKGGTTTFATQMRQSPSMMFSFGCTAYEKYPPFCENGTNKEGHLFDRYAKLGMKHVAKAYPECRYDIRMVATDQTPRYFVEPWVPKNIAKMYGPLKDKIKFIALLREPVSRFHSDYYHGRQDGWCWWYWTNSFRAVVDGLVNRNTWNVYTGATDGCGGRLQESLYPASLEHWFAKFPASQFIIVPYLYISDPGNGGRPSTTVVENMWNMLGVEHGNLGAVGSHQNKRTHPSLEEDVEEELLKAFRRLVWSENGPDANAHVLASHPGVKLYGYTGLAEDTVAIAKWLQKNW